MKNKIYFLLSVLVSTSLFAQEYVVPPTNTTRSHVPVISDDAMEVCVKLYNEAEWLIKEIDTVVVDNYSQKSVDNYNHKIKKHSSMTTTFNRDCAGKQSRSAYEATQKLNNQNQFRN